MFKCTNCKLIFKEELQNCPECGKLLQEMCKVDTGVCNHNVVDGVKVCSECGEYMCPECNSHDVSVISRVTGYYSPVDSWCEGKKQEIKDRHRYAIGD